MFCGKAMSTFTTRSSQNLVLMFSVMEARHSAGMAETTTPITRPSYGNQEKKKRLTSDQIESLERSFQEEVKLDPDRKMKLSRELGLQPRQIAVWFQNRRARWKAKQLESLYDSLKQQFDVISREKQKLQDEVGILNYLYKHQCHLLFSNRVALVQSKQHLLA